MGCLGPSFHGSRQPLWGGTWHHFFKFTYPWSTTPPGPIRYRVLTSWLGLIRSLLPLEQALPVKKTSAKIVTYSFWFKIIQNYPYGMLHR